MTAEHQPNEETSTLPPEAVPGSRRWWLRPLLALLLLAAVIGAYAAGLHTYLDWDYIRAHVNAWQKLAQEHLLFAAVIYCAVYIGLTALSIPAAGILSLLSGALFGRWLGVPLASLSATTGGTLAFLASRYLFHDWVRRRFGHRLRIIDQGMRRDGAFYLFSLRLTPLVPFFLINFGMALTPIRATTFAVVSWLGMVFPCYLYVNAGTALAHIERPADALAPEVVVSLALLAIVPVVLRWAFVRLRRM